jgi:hypothetical protein
VESTPSGYNQVPTDNFHLRIKFSGMITSVRIPIIRITLPGRQIATILPWDEEAALRSVAGSIGDEVEAKVFKTRDDK